MDALRRHCVDVTPLGVESGELSKRTVSAVLAGAGFLVRRVGFVGFFVRHPVLRAIRWPRQRPGHETAMICPAHRNVDLNDWPRTLSFAKDTTPRVLRKAYRVATSGVRSACSVRESTEKHEC